MTGESSQASNLSRCLLDSPRRAALSVETRLRGLDKTTPAQVAAQTLTGLDFGKLFATMQDPAAVGRLLSNPGSVGELFAKTSPTVELGAAGVAAMTYAERECPARDLSGDAWQPGGSCIDVARERLNALRPLPEDFHLSEWETVALGRVGITDELLHEPFPVPEPPVVPEA